MNLYVFKVFVVFVVFCSFSLTVDMIWLFWNESGPEIEPWGTPHVMLVWADVNLLIVTQKFLLCRFHVNQLTVFSSTTALMSPGDPACGCRLLMCSMVPVRPLTSRLSSHADMVIDSMLASGQLEEDGREKVREAMLRRHHHQSEKNLRNRIPLVRSFADIGKKHSDPHLLERNGETAELLSFWYSLLKYSCADLQEGLVLMSRFWLITQIHPGAEKEDTCLNISIIMTFEWSWQETVRLCKTRQFSGQMATWWRDGFSDSTRTLSLSQILSQRLWMRLYSTVKLKLLKVFMSCVTNCRCWNLHLHQTKRWILPPVPVQSALKMLFIHEEASYMLTKKLS